MRLSLGLSLIKAVVCEARVCGTGQPVIIAGDLNASLFSVPASCLGGPLSVGKAPPARCIPF